MNFITITDSKFFFFIYSVLLLLLLKCHIINILEIAYIFVNSDCYFSLLSFKVDMY